MWAPADSYSNTVVFTYRLAFRRSYSGQFCDETTISQGSLIGEGSWEADCINGFSGHCYSRTVSTGLYRCTDFSAIEDWSMGESSFNYTFSSAGEEWSVSYSSCCWISLSRYGNGGWLVETSINLTRRSDNGRINSSPISRSAAFVRFHEGCPRSIRIPTEDPDGDVVRCRHSTYSESLIYSDSFPYGELDEKSCVLTYDGSSYTAGTYAVALTLEDFPAGTTNFSNVKPFSTIGLQFLAIISSYSGSCNDTPVFTGSTPQDGECSELQVGLVYTAVIQVSVADPSRQIVEIITSSPLGMQLTTLSYHGGIYQRNVTWYPNQQQIGQQVFCFKGVDSAGFETEFRCVTILVGLSNTPQVIIGSRSPTAPVSTTGPGYVQLSIQFDRLIKKPRTSSYIRLVLLPSGHTMYKVDTLSQYVIIGGNDTVLYFGMPKAAFSMSGLYAILIDQGAVVGQGCSYDGPPTPGVQSQSDWQFVGNGVCSFGYYLSPPSFTSCVDINECNAPSSSAIIPTSASSYMPVTASVTPVNFFSALASPLDFMLHIPAGCEHACTNIPGSYICSCPSGYELDSDGKSCIDTDECSNRNGGCSHNCFNTIGSFYCGCPEGMPMTSNNLTCDDSSASVTCTRNGMTVTFEKEKYYFFNASDLRLRYASCRATENSTHFIISTPLNDCGTLVNETEHVLIFWNEVQADALIIDNVVTRTHDVKLPFSCSYTRKSLLSLGFTPQSIYLGEEAGYGNFTFKMDFYDSLFSTPYTEKDLPLDVPLNDYIYVEYSVESSANLAVMAITCKATKDGSFYSWPQYTFIENGCPRDTTLDYSYDPTGSFQQFRMKTFRFFNNYDTVFIHCELFACHKNSPNSRCSRGCLNSKRRKRDVTRDNTEREESTTKVVLTRGPLLLKEKKESGSGKQTALIGGVAGVSVFGLIAVIALAVLCVKFRRAQRFTHGKEPADLNVFQNDHMGKTNLGVSELDSC